MKRRKKKMGFFLKLVVATLAVYAAVQLVVLQIEINAQRSMQEQRTTQREELRQKNAALRSFIESEVDDETIAQIARDEWGYVMPYEHLYVDIGH